MKESGKLLNKAISHVHEIQKCFKLQSKDVLINSAQAMDASLVVTESSGIESERNSSENALSKSMNETLIQMQEGKVDMGKALDDGSFVTESSGTKSDKRDTSSRSGNDANIKDAVIRPVNDQEPFDEVDSNTTLDLTNMCHRRGEIDQNAKKYQVSCPLLDPSSDNMTTEFSNQSLTSGNISLKKTVAQLQNDFSRMETHCVNMELKYQNQALKDGQLGQILNETSNKAKIKKEIKVLEMIDIELERSVAKLLTKNENKTVENADLKAQIQEKVFMNVALKNELSKLKGNNMDTKFVKPSILGKPILQPPRNQSVVRQPNAFKSERPNFSKPRFASQVDVNNILSKPITQHYFPKGRESAFAKPNHMIAPDSSRNSSKESYGSNDMAHNYYLEEAKKKTQDKNKNLKPREMPSARTHHTPNACTPKPRSYNQTSNWLASKSSEETLKAVQKVDHSRNHSSFLDSNTLVQSPKTRNSNKPVEPKIHTQKPSRQIVTGHRFSPNKSSVVHEKTNTPRSCLRWIPTGRIFNTIGLRWVPTGKTFTSSSTKVDCKPPIGSNEDITNPYECDQTLNVSVGTFNLSAGTSFNPKKERLRVWLLKKLMSKNQVPQGIHKQKQSPNSSQGVREQHKCAHFDDPCHELLHEVYISQGSSSNVHK
ncbi:hypothetical protein Tco_1268322 [Tanacetum coccineum]